MTDMDALERVISSIDDIDNRLALRALIRELRAARAVVAEVTEDMVEDAVCDKNWSDDEGNFLTCRDVFAENDAEQMCAECRFVDAWYRYRKVRSP